MGLFDPDTVLSAEAGTLWHLADLLAECTAAQALAEATGSDSEKKATTRAKVRTCGALPPWDSQSYTIEQIQNQFIEFLLWPLNENSATVRASGFDRADNGGAFHLYVRRHIREGELIVPDSDSAEEQLADQTSDVYLFFLDCVAALAVQLIEGAESRNCPRLQTAQRTDGPHFGSKKTESAQGRYVFAGIEITWGDPISE